MSNSTGLGNNLSALLGGTARQRARLRERESADERVTGKAAVKNKADHVDEAASNHPHADVSSVGDDEHTDHLRQLPIESITRGVYQPRREFDPALLQELADSIQAQGLIQPILVRANSDDNAGQYELIAGERRWRAAKLAGLTEIPAIVRVMDDQSVAAAALIENIQRADLNPLEEAAALERLCEDFRMTHQEVADAVGRSRTAVTNLMRLLELHDDVKVMIDRGELDMGHGRALLGATRDDQPEIAQRVVTKQLSVRAVEKLVKELRAGKSITRSEPEPLDVNLETRVEELGDWLDTVTAVKQGQGGGGKIEIRYGSVEELDRVLGQIEQLRNKVVLLRGVKG